MNGVLKGERPDFLGPFVHRKRETTHSVPSKVFLKLIAHKAMLFAPFSYTHPLPPVPPFLLMDNLSPRDTA